MLRPPIRKLYTAHALVLIQLEARLNEVQIFGEVVA